MSLGKRNARAFPMTGIAPVNAKRRGGPRCAVAVVDAQVLWCVTAVREAAETTGLLRRRATTSVSAIGVDAAIAGNAGVPPRYQVG